MNAIQNVSCYLPVGSMIIGWGEWAILFSVSLIKSLCSQEVGFIFLSNQLVINIALFMVCAEKC